MTTLNKQTTLILIIILALTTGASGTAGIAAAPQARPYQTGIVDITRYINPQYLWGQTEGLGYLIANSQQEFYDHHSCSFGRCYETCINEKWENPSWAEIEAAITDGALKCLGAEAGEAFKNAFEYAQQGSCAYTCTTAESIDEKSACAQCAISSVAGNLPGGGCVISLWNEFGTQLRPHAECIQECSGDPFTWSRNWGHECRDGLSSERMRCYDLGLNFDVVREFSCQDCNFQPKPDGELITCKSDEHCEQVGMTQARCVKDGEDTKPPKKPGNDKPDDSFDISSMALFKEPSIAVASTVNEDSALRPLVVLARGFFGQSYAIVRNSRVSARLLSLRSVENLDPDQVGVLVIPSGGLYGLDGSSTFKGWLEDFVRDGGRLVVFAQQHGGEYSLLPGAPSAYGWLEDQRCQYASAAISTYHPVFAGQRDFVLSVNVDGYFRSVPENSTVLLSRTKNGQPAMILYPYGRGTVLATTLYSDMAEGLQMGSAEDRQLLKDIMAWAQTRLETPTYPYGMLNLTLNITNTNYAPLSYPVAEYSSGETVNTWFNVSNTGNLTSEKVSFILVDPVYTIHIVNVSASIAPNETKEVNLSYTPTGLLDDGIWLVSYTLYQGGTPVSDGFAGEFAYDYNITALSDLQVYVTIRDPEGKNVLEHDQNITVLPGGTAPVNISLNASQYGIWTARYTVIRGDGKKLYSEAQPFAISRFTEVPDGLGFTESDMSLTVTSRDEEYPYGAPAEFTFHIYNHVNETRNATVFWGLIHHSWRGLIPRGPDNALNRTVEVPPLGYVNFTYTLPSVVDLDRLRAKLYVNNSLMMKAERGLLLYIPKPEISVDTTKDAYFWGENATITLNVSNTADTWIHTINGTEIVYEPLLSVGIPGETPMGWTLNISPLSSRLYTFNWTVPSNATPRMLPAVADFYYRRTTLNPPVQAIEPGTRTVTTHYFKVGDPLTIKVDKPSYMVRDNLTFDILTETFTVPWNATLNITIPAIGYMKVISINQTAGENTTIPFSIPIPVGTAPGVHEINVQSIENEHTETGSFVIPQSSLDGTIYADPGLQAGDNITLNLSNTGGVDTNYTFKAGLVDIYLNEVSALAGSDLPIRAGEELAFKLPIPSDVVLGKYYLTFDFQDASTGQKGFRALILNITGQEGSASTVPGQDIYLYGDNITLSSSVKSTGLPLSNANLTIKVVGQNYSKTAPPTACVEPIDDLQITSDTVLCPGVYNINDAKFDGVIFIGVSNVSLQGYNTYLIGAGFGYGIRQIWGSNVNISGITIINYSTGVYLSGKNTVRDMTVKGVKTGMRVSHSSRITDNYIEIISNGFGTSYGMTVLYASGFGSSLITGNTIVGTGELINITAGISNGIATAAAPGTTLVNNTIRNVGTGISVESVNLTIENNSITDSVVGLDLSWGSCSPYPSCRYNNFRNVIVKGNFISNNSQDGITLSNAWNSSFINNIVTHNADGISSSSTSDTFVGNTFCSNTNNDVYITPYDGTVYYNYGDENTCDKIRDDSIHPPWHDNGTTGCTYTCPAPGGGVLSVAQTPHRGVAKTQAPPIKAQATPPAIGNKTILWETTKNISTSTNTTIPLNPGNLSALGKIYVYTHLYSTSGQLLGSDISTFYIVDGDLALTMETDKEVYKPGENITISGNVTNLGAGPQNGITLALKADGSTFYTEGSFDLAAGETHPYAVQRTASSSFILQGTAGGTSINDTITVEQPTINATLTAPDMAGREAFNVSFAIENTGNVTATLHVLMLNETQDLSVEPGSQSIVTVTTSITGNTTISAAISGDVAETVEKNITFGEAAEIEVTPEDVYPVGEVTVPFKVFNTGLLETAFNATFTVGGGNRIAEIILPPGSNQSGEVSFNLLKGMHTLTYSSPFWSNQTTLNVEGPAKLVLTSLPVNESVNPGERVNFTVRVKNTGGTTGPAEVNLSSPGLFNAFNRTWIPAGAEVNITLPALIPDDIDADSYRLIAGLNGHENETTLWINGAQIAVTATLEGKFYHEGDTAKLSLNITNQNSLDLELFARIGFNVYENVTGFNLTGLGEAPLAFNVPVNFTGGSRILTSIYMASGRSLYINSLPVHEAPPAGAGILLYTDKDVYTMGENATIYVNTTLLGSLNLTAPGYSYTSALDAGVNTTLNFTVPELLTGTYYLNYTYNGYSLTYPFDVDGYYARITGLDLDKESYRPGDTFTFTGTVEVNRAFNATINLSLYDDEEVLIDVYTFGHEFRSGVNTLSYIGVLWPESGGLHSIVPRVIIDLPGHSPVTLVSASKYFDVELNNTKPGKNVIVKLPPWVNVTFTKVTSEGETTAAPADAYYPLPSNFNLSGTVYDIHTTSTYNGTVEVCIAYNESLYEDESSLRLLHFENGTWVEVTTTVDTDANIVCGEVTGFSVFAVAGFIKQADSNPASGGGGGGGSSPGLPAGEKVLVVANSIDKPLATDFLSYLAENNIEATVLNATRFTEDVKQNNRLIIILGGPDAPEGIGGIVRDALSDAEEAGIKQTGSQLMYAKYDVWTNRYTAKQLVIIVAGSDRENTMAAETLYRAEVQKRIIG